MTDPVKTKISAKGETEGSTERFPSCLLKRRDRRLDGEISSILTEKERQKARLGDFLLPLYFKEN